MTSKPGSRSTVTRPPTSLVRYFHCHQFDALPRIGEHDLKVGVTDLVIDNEDEAVEYVQQRVL